jgi:hypothetical protein
MRILITIIIVSLALGAAAQTPGPIISNPIPAPIEKRGLMVEIQDLVRLPDTRGMRPADQDTNPAGRARINYVRDLPDGRRFVNDSRGILYVLDKDNQPAVYANVAAVYPNGAYTALAGGFTGFAFHPEFSRNGLFYTMHVERATADVAPHFIPPGFTAADVTHHNVLTEWHATNPAANTFAGTRRVLLRVAHVVNSPTHPFGHLEFNPISKPGDPDYGLLYTSGSDTGFSNGQGPNARNPSQLQRLDTLIGAILRIDPRSPSVSGGTKGLGDYTVPRINKFAADGDPKTLGEIYAYGFRNAHKLSWDLTDGTMFASDIGMNHVEEINIVHEGQNYGWMKREGFFENGQTRPGGALNQLYPLPTDVMNGREKDGYTYPVAMYDHDEGRSVSAGFPYYGRIEALRGKFVFGDVATGRVFAADLAALKKADDGIPQTVAQIDEIQLYVRDSSGNRTNVTLQQLVDKTNGAATSRADLNISRTRDGELLISSRQDGTIRMLVPDSAGTAPSPRR